MNIKNNIKIGFAAMVVALGMTSCNDWLSVEMEDSIMENDLFSNDEGYLSNLNGVYAKMNENYGLRLTMGGIDVMAQYYNVSQNVNSNFYNYANFKYDELEDVSNSIWTTQYSLIANLNTLLDHVASADGSLSAKYLPYVKGEALALRAFLHFDLMRMYGPIYSAATENDKAIPYQETSSKDIQPILSAKDVMAKIIRDLKDASELLKDDRIRTDGVVNTAAENLSESTTLRYRQFRMNYYAVQALLARAYMWIGDKTNAATIAKSIIEENDEKNVFPWTPKAQVTTDKNPDKLFSTEVMFSMYNTSRASLYNSYFNTTVSSASGLTMAIATYEELDWNTWEYVTYTLKKIDKFFDEENDLRKQYLWTEAEMRTTDEYGASTTQQAHFCSKYAPLNNTASPTANARCFQYMIPLVRMSELYLMLAECEIANHDTAIGYVNKIRQNRNCPNIVLAGTESDDAIKQYITNEFMREFVGEGQLYFYYKRNAMQSVLGDGEVYNGALVNRTMDLSDYIWPLPPVEVDKRVKE